MSSQCSVINTDTKIMKFSLNYKMVYTNIQKIHNSCSNSKICPHKAFSCDLSAVGQDKLKKRSLCIEGFPSIHFLNLCTGSVGCQSLTRLLSGRGRIQFASLSQTTSGELISFGLRHRERSEKTLPVIPLKEDPSHSLTTLSEKRSSLVVSSCFCLHQSPKRSTVTFTHWWRQSYARHCGSNVGFTQEPFHTRAGRTGTTPGTWWFKTDHSTPVPWLPYDSWLNE